MRPLLHHKNRKKNERTILNMSERKANVVQIIRDSVRHHNFISATTTSPPIAIATHNSLAKLSHKQCLKYLSPTLPKEKKKHRKKPSKLQSHYIKIFRFFKKHRAKCVQSS